MLILFELHAHTHTTTHQIVFVLSAGRSEDRLPNEIGIEDVRDLKNYYQYFDELVDISDTGELLIHLPDSVKESVRKSARTEVERSSGGESRG